MESEVGSEASLEAIEEAVHRLDGTQHTVMTVEVGSGKTLTIGGGPKLFVAEVAEDESTRWAVIKPIAGDEHIDLRVGGSLAAYPARLCVDMKAVLAVVRTFVLHDGARSKEVTWSVES
jgi:hypothetical protein